MAISHTDDRSVVVVVVVIYHAGWTGSQLVSEWISMCYNMVNLNSFLVPFLLGFLRFLSLLRQVGCTSNNLFRVFTQLEPSVYFTDSFDIRRVACRCN